MKPTLIASLAVLLLFVALGWRNQSRLSAARETNAGLIARAESLGLIAEEEKHPEKSTRRDRPDRSASAIAVADELIAFAKEMEDLEKKNPSPEDMEAIQKRVLEHMDKLASLDAAQIKILIDRIRGDASLKDQTRHGLITFSMMTLANDHPQAALGIFTNSFDLLPDSRTNKQIVSSALARWAKQDPDAALGWVRENNPKFPDLIDTDTRQALITGVAAHDPSRALALIDELGISAKENGREAAFTKIAGAAVTPAQRAALLEALRKHAAENPSSDKAVQSAIGSLGDSLAHDGFESASTWLADAKLDEKELKAFGEGVKNSIKDGDQPKWLDWMGKNLPPQDAANTVFSTVSDWTRKDYQAAGNWLVAAPEGPVKTAAVRAYAASVAPYEPETAEKWALTLPAGNDRDMAIRGIHISWPKSDPEGAAAFKLKYNLTD